MSYNNTMLSDIVNAQTENNEAPVPPVPAHLACWWAELQTSLALSVSKPETSLGDLEILLEQSGKMLLGAILAPAVQALAERTPMLCPCCRTALHLEARAQGRSISTSVGPLEFSRDYGWCPRCKKWFHPADLRLGLAPKAQASPRVQEMASLLTLKMPAAQAEDVFEKVTGLQLSRSTLGREAHRQGERALAIRQAQCAQAQSPQGVARLSANAAPSLPTQPFTLVIELDAFNIRERDWWGQTKERIEKGEEVSRWHWVYVATCFRLDQRGQTAGERPFITERGFVATRLGIEEFDRQIYAEALQRGLSSASKVLVIADGALWIWNWAEDRFEYATHRIDLWHVKDHLWAVADELFGTGSAEASAWIRPLLEQLENSTDGPQQIVNRLEQIKTAMTNLTSNQKEALDKEIAYVKNNQHRMDYASAKAAGEPLGSGAIESTCRQYQCRFKRTGQFWSLDGDEALLALETLYRNGRWNLLFPHRKTPMQNN